MKSKKKTFRMGIIIVIIFFSVLSGIYFYPSVSDRILLQKDLKRFSQDTYDSVFLSMHSPSGYTKENFLNYNGLHTSVSSREIYNAIWKKYSPLVIRLAMYFFYWILI